MRGWRVTILAASVAVFALGMTASVEAATTLADPIVGIWKVTDGGSGTIKIAERAGVLAITAQGVVTLGCLREGDNIAGFIDLPRNTGLPAGRYNGNFGVSGQGCYYNVALTLARGTLTGKVVFSENDQPGGPFTLVKVGATKYRWTVKTKAFSGGGSVTTDARGNVTAAAGTLSTPRWKLGVRAPANLTFGANSSFALTLSARVTSGKCSDKLGTLVLSGGKARLVGVCGRTLSGTGTVALAA